MGIRPKNQGNKNGKGLGPNLDCHAVVVVVVVLLVVVVVVVSAAA